MSYGAKQEILRMKEEDNEVVFGMRNPESGLVMVCFSSISPKTGQVDDDLETLPGLPCVYDERDGYGYDTLVITTDKCDELGIEYEDLPLVDLPNWNFDK